MDFSDSIVVYIRFDRFCQLNGFMKLYDIKGQGHSLTFVQCNPDSTFSKFFCSETARLIEAKFQRRLHGMWGMKICSNVPGHTTMPIYGEKLKNSSSSEPRG